MRGTRPHVWRNTTDSPPSRCTTRHRWRGCFGVARAPLLAETLVDTFAVGGAPLGRGGGGAPVSVPPPPPGGFPPRPPPPPPARPPPPGRGGAARGPARLITWSGVVERL